MIHLIKNNKFKILIFLLLSFLIPFFVYTAEDKNKYYEAKINLANIDNEFKPIFKNFLNKNTYLENDKDTSLKCKTAYDDSNKAGAFLQMSIVISQNQKEEKKEIEKIKSKCKKIIIKTMDDYIAFKNEVINFYERNDDDGFYSNYVLPKKVEIYNANFFLNYTRQKINEDSINLVKTYEPSTIKQHLINLFFTILIIFALFIGFLIAKQNLRER